MKKALFFIVALAAVAIGCTKSEVVKAPGRGREIKFDTYVGKAPVTKAESADLAYLQRALESEGGFQVYAFLHNYITPTTQVPEDGSQVYYGDDKYVDVTSVGTSTAYMDKEVKYVETTPDDPATEDVNESAGYWDYPGVVYWPDHSTSRKLAFAAYALNVKDLIAWEDDPAVAGNEKTGHIEGKSYTKFTYSVPSAVAAQKDLLVTPFLPNQGLSENANAAPVELNFRHLLSRIGFQLVTNEGGDPDVDVDIQEVTLYGNFPVKGKVNLKGNGVIEPITEGNDAEFATSYTLFPGNEHFMTKSTTIPTDIFANLIPTEETTGEGDEAVTKIVDKPSTDKSNRYMMIMPSKQAKNIADPVEQADETEEPEGTDDETEGTEEEETEVLPGAYLLVQYQLTEADVQTARVSLDGWEFKPGTSYNFIFKVSTSSIQFDVEVSDWSDYFAAGPNGADGNPTYPNGNGIYTLLPM